MSKTQFDLKKSAKVTYREDTCKNCTHVSRRSDGSTGTAAMEISCNIAYTPLEKKSILHELQEKDDEVRQERQYECLRRPVLEEQDRAERHAKDAQYFAGRAQDETTADKENQGGTSRATNTTTGNHGRWTTSGQDARVDLLPRQTVLRVGSADSRSGGCHSVATEAEAREASKTVTGNVAEEDERTSKKVAPSDNEIGAKGRTRRPREPSETVASDGLTTKTTAKSSAT